MDQRITYVWPTPIHDVRDPKWPGLRQGDTQRARRKRLSKIGEEGFSRYVQDILPKELEVDTEWRGAYQDTDGSRNNFGFLRWQKKVFSLFSRTSVQELNWDGTRVPKYKGVPYHWPEWHDSEDYSNFLKMLQKWCGRYLHQTRGDDERVRIFVSVEVYRPGDFQTPHMHTGAPVSGLYVARSNRHQELVFADERGKTPPFGREHYMNLTSGQLLLFPSWVQNAFTPNRGSSTNVYFCFWASFRGGIADFDWEDDPAGDYVPSKNNRIKREAGSGQSAGRAARESDEL